MILEEFESALSELMDNEITAGKFERLQAHLASSREARDEYRDFIDLHQILHLEIATPAIPVPMIPMGVVIERQERRVLPMAVFTGVAAVLMGVLVSTFVLLPKPPPVRFEASSLAGFTVEHSTARGPGYLRALNWRSAHG